MRLLRKLMHAALAIVPLAGWLFAPWVALALAAALMAGSAVLEVARRIWPGVDGTLWGHAPSLFRSWESQGILGSTWFAVSMLGILLLFGQDVGGLAVLFLALADPAAELAGRRWGRPGVRKTWAGSLACLGVCLAIATAGFLLGLVPPAAAVAGGVAAAAAERWSPPPTDNVWMPLFSSMVMVACLQILAALA
jgi:dolichol kinase